MLVLLLAAILVLLITFYSLVGTSSELEQNLYFIQKKLKVSPRHTMAICEHTIRLDQRKQVLYFIEKDHDSRKLIKFYVGPQDHHAFLVMEYYKNDERTSNAQFSRKHAVEAELLRDVRVTVKCIRKQME